MFDFGGVMVEADKPVTIKHVLAGGFTLDLDGSDDLVLVPDSATFEPVNELTIEVWIRPDTIGTSNARIVRHQASGFGYILAWQQQNDRRAQLRIDGTTTGNVAVKDDVSIETYLGEWHHLAGVYSFVSDFARLYVDGALKGEAPAAGQMVYTNTPLSFGNDPIGTEEFDGSIDELRIWSIARTASEIHSTMYKPLIGNEPGLVGYWRFDEQSGQTVFDSSSFNNDGILGNDGNMNGDPADPLRVLSGAPIFTGAVTGLGVSGPDAVAENFHAAYTATLTFEDGVAEGTAVVAWSIDPIEAGSIDDAGSLTTGDIDGCADLSATISADYVDSLGSTIEQKPVTVLATGGADQGLEFDGFNSIILVPKSSSLEPNNELTDECWVNGGGSGGDNAVILRNQGVSAKGFALRWRNSDAPLGARVDFMITNDAGQLFVTDPTPSSTYVGSWHHLAAVYSDTGGFARLFVDGQLVAENASTGPLTWSAFSFYFWIGNATGVGQDEEEYDGVIDEVRYWNVARTGTEINSTLFARLEGDEPGLVGYWRFDEGSGQSVADLSSSQNHGTLGFNPMMLDTADPTWVASDAPLGFPPISGDAGLDGLTNGLDIQWFVGLIFDGPGGDPQRIAEADFDCNGIVDGEDVAPFVSTLLGGYRIVESLKKRGRLEKRGRGKKGSGVFF